MNELQKSDSLLPNKITGTWNGARQWMSAASLMEQGKLFCQVMVGFELIELHKKHGVTHGDNQHDGRTSHDGKSTWDEILQSETGMSTSTAYRFMDMAKAAAPRLKKLPELRQFDPLAKPLALLTAPQKEALTTGVRKLTDGKTQKEFGEQLGLWKKPPGNPDATGGEARKLTTAEQSDKARDKALKDSGRMGLAIKESNANFFLLTDTNDLELDAQIAVLEFAIKLRKLWSRTPKAKRDAKVIESMIQHESPLKA